MGSVLYAICGLLRARRAKVAHPQHTCMRPTVSGSLEAGSAGPQWHCLQSGLFSCCHAQAEEAQKENALPESGESSQQASKGPPSSPLPKAPGGHQKLVLGGKEQQVQA